MSISVGTSAYANVPDNGAASGTTGAINTTGVSTLYLRCIQKGGTSPLIPSDSAGNTWTRIGSQISTPGGTLTLDRWYCKGPTTSATHTFTVTNTSGTSRFQIQCDPISGADSVAPLDQSNTSTATSATPWSSGSVTISSGNGTLGEIAFSSGTTDAGTETSWTEANGFTVDHSQIFGAGFPHNASGAFGHKAISAAGTYSASWTDGSTGSPNFAGIIDTFLAAAGSASITPTAGALSLAAVASTVTSGTVTSRVPTIGALSLSGIAATITPGTVTPITPTVGALNFTGIVSTQTLTVPVPAAGAVLFSGIAPSVTVSAPSITPSVGALTLSGLSATLNLGIAPAVGTLTASGLTPVLSVGLAPGAGSLTLSGISPGRVVGTVSSPLVSALSLSGVAPSLINGTVIAATAGSVSLSGVASILGLGMLSTAGALALSGQPVGIGTQGVVTPPAGALTLSTAASVLGRSLVTNAGSLAATGAPTSLGLSIAAVAGSLTLAGNVPTFGFTAIAPATGALTLTGMGSPSGVVSTPVCGQLGFNTDVPRVYIGYAALALYLRPFPAPLAQVKGGLLVAEEV